MVQVVTQDADLARCVLAKGYRPACKGLRVGNAVGVNPAQAGVTAHRNVRNTGFFEGFTLRAEARTGVEICGVLLRMQVDAVQTALPRRTDQHIQYCGPVAMAAVVREYRHAPDLAVG